MHTKDLPGVLVDYGIQESQVRLEKFATLFLSFELNSKDEPILLKNYTDIKLFCSLEKAVISKQAIKVYFENGGKYLYIMGHPQVDIYNIDKENIQVDYFRKLAQKCDTLTDIETILAIDLVAYLKRNNLDEDKIIKFQNIIADYAYNMDKMYCKNSLFIADIPNKISYPSEYAKKLQKTMVFYPWIKNKDGFVVSPSVCVAGLLSKYGIENKIQYSIGNRVLNRVIDLDNNSLLESDDILYKYSINPVRYISNDGYKVWGVKTLNFENKSLEYINVLRIYLYIKRSIYLMFKSYIFESNDSELKYKISRNLTKFLFKLWKQGALEGNSENEAYLIICDNSNNTEQDRRDGKLLFDIFVSISKPLEYINIRLNMLLDISEEGASISVI